MLTLSRFTKAKISIGFFFEMVGFMIGNWVARIPAVKDVHHLSDGIFGVILICGIFGALLCLPVVTFIVKRFGSAVGVMIGALVTIGLIPVIGITQGGIGVLAVGIMGLGFGMGVVDVSMNAQASCYEKCVHRHTMGFFHANYAIGSFVGALVGGAFAQRGVTPLKQFVLVSLISLFFSILFYFWLFPKEEEDTIVGNFQPLVSHTDADEKVVAVSHSSDVEEVSTAAVSPSPTPPPHQAVDYENKKCSLRRIVDNWDFILLCAIAFISSLGEGSINDWITIFCVESLQFSELLAAVAFAAFELFLATGRLFSDMLVSKYGSLRVLRMLGVFSCIGLAIAASAPLFVGTLRVVVAILGLAVCGGGISVCSPIVISVASRLPGYNPSDAIAILTTFIYLAMLVGPPLIGGLSVLLGELQWALFADASLLAVMVACIYGVNSAGQGSTKTGSHESVEPADLTAKAHWNPDSVNNPMRDGNDATPATPTDSQRTPLLANSV